MCALSIIISLPDFGGKFKNLVLACHLVVKAWFITTLWVTSIFMKSYQRSDYGLHVPNEQLVEFLFSSFNKGFHGRASVVLDAWPRPQGILPVGPPKCILGLSGDKLVCSSLVGKRLAVLCERHAPSKRLAILCEHHALSGRPCSV